MSTTTPEAFIDRWATRALLPEMRHDIEVLQQAAVRQAWNAALDAAVERVSRCPELPTLAHIKHVIRELKHV